MNQNDWNNENDPRTNEFFTHGYYPPEQPLKKSRAHIWRALGKTAVSLALVATIAAGSVAGYDFYLRQRGQTPAANGSGTGATAGATNTVYLPTYDEDAMTIPEIFQKAVPSVVSINVTVQTAYGQTGEGSGTGIVMTKDGYIITNEHVVDGATAINVRLNDGRALTAKLIGADANTDIAVIKVDANDLTPAEFGTSSSLVTGEPAIVVGNPLGIQFAETLTEGVISAPSREVTIGQYVMNLIQTNAAINPGNSGGPLLNSTGQVVGVVNAKIMQSNMNDVEGIGFAIPIETALSIANDLVEHGEVTTRAMLGVSVSSLTEEEAAVYGRPAGIIVQEVSPGGSAEKAGVQMGDKIVSFNGTEVKTFTELNYEKDKCKPGDTVKMEVEREGKRIELSITLQSSSTAQP